MDFNPRWGDAIASIESGGESSPYTSITPNPGGRRALGKYQVMEENLPEWTQAALGKPLNRDQFLADPAAQEAVFKHRFGGYVDKYGTPQDAASAWFTGRPINAQSAAAHDSLGTTGASYVDKFNRHLAANGDGVSAINAAAGVSPDAPGALTTAFAPTEKTSMPALSADSTLGPGALAPDAPKTGLFGLPTISDNSYDALMGMASSLAGISDPDHAKALIAQQAAMRKTAADQGTWSIHTYPDGTSMYVNSKDPRRTIAIPGNHAAPEKDVYQQEADKLAAKAAADRYGDVTTAMATADQNLSKIQKMRKATLDPNVTFGGTGDITAAAKNYLYSLGGNPDGLTSTQMVEQAAKENQLGHAKALGANPTNYEDKIVSASQGLGLDRTRELNLANQDALEAVYQHQKALAQEAIKYKKANGKLDDGWLEHQAQWEQEHPLDTSPRTRFQAGAAAASAAAAKTNTFKSPSGKTINWSY